MLRGTAVFVALLALGTLAASPGIRLFAVSTASGALENAKAALAGREQENVTLTLPARDVYALQLGVYDNGERARQEQQRLSQAGIPCVVWQGERMRIVCAAAPDAQALEDAEAGGMETYVVADALPQVRLGLGGQRWEIETARALLTLPDALFDVLCVGEQAQPLEDILGRAREAANKALPSEGSELLKQLAKSLSDWCALVDRTRGTADGGVLRQYAALTMGTLCRELRTQLLLKQAA